MNLKKDKKKIKQTFKVDYSQVLYLHETIYYLTPSVSRREFSHTVYSVKIT